MSPLADALRKFNVKLNTLKPDKNGCILWPWAKSGKGYGDQVGMGRYFRAHFRAHRLAYILEHGPIADNIFVCHECDVMHCVNYKYLFLGTHRDNMFNASMKGRLAERLAGRHFSNKPQWSETKRKLTINEVRFIKDLYIKGFTQVYISKLFCVSSTLINYILHNKYYKDVV